MGMHKKLGWVLILSLATACSSHVKTEDVHAIANTNDSAKIKPASATKDTLQYGYGYSHKEVSTTLQQFIPQGYQVLDTFSGDLNLDAIPDMAMVLKKPNEKNIEMDDTAGWRPLLLLLGKGDGTYTLAARNDKVAYCFNCGGMMGDPLQGVTIKKGNFSVEHYGGSNWRWSKIITFKYRPSDRKWYLFRDGGESSHLISNDDSEEANFEVHKNPLENVNGYGKVAFEGYDIYLDTVSKK